MKVATDSTHKFEKESLSNASKEKHELLFIEVQLSLANTAAAQGLDVYEEEKRLFFEDHSEDILQDDVIARVMNFQNVLISSHLAFLTDTALQNIAETTMHNLNCFEKNISCKNELKSGCN